VEWEVWLTDGRVLSSVSHQWADVPDGVLVVRLWGPNWVSWGDGVYGQPGTWKNAGWVDDDTFLRVLAEARSPGRLPPSRRS
jgi:hypothetical protein